MNALKIIATGADSWDVYASDRDEFLAEVTFQDFDKVNNSCVLSCDFAATSVEEYVKILNHFTVESIFTRKISQLKVSIPLSDELGLKAYERAGFLAGRDYGSEQKRARRFTCDRYDVVRNIAEGLMSEHLDVNLWTFGWDSAKKRLGVCKYDEHLISLSRYFVDLHSLDEIDQVMRHEIAHALAGSKAGHGAQWKKIATELGYNHKRISGDEIANATAKLVGSCPNGHVVYRHRKPNSQLSCSRCSKRFDARFLITWTTR